MSREAIRSLGSSVPGVGAQAHGVVIVLPLFSADRASWAIRTHSLPAARISSMTSVYSNQSS